MTEGPVRRDLWGQFLALAPARRLALVGTAAASLAFFLWVTLATSEGSYRTLYRGLPEDQMGKLIDVLDAQRISYRLESAGTVLVPAGQVHEARIRVAEKGLPSGSGVGFELFDRPGFGVTDFVHRVNFQRALQGELARSIEQLDPVTRARVQLALPERSPFVADRSRTPSASVVLRLAPGHELDMQQVSGIVHLVASSVEALQPERVSVIDDRGRLLSASGEGAAGAGAPPGAHSYQTRLEQELGRRIESILEPIVGRGSVVARVHAELDWTQTETTEERFDPDSQIERSEQRSEETSSEGSGNGGGIPGARTSGGAGGAGSSTVRTDETINYELNKLITRSSSGVARVVRVTAAVLVDGKPQPGLQIAPDATAPEGEEGTTGAAREFVAWDAAELEKFRGLAQQAIGFSEERGDELVISSAPFRSLELPSEEGGLSPDIVVLATEAVRYLLLIGAVAAFGLLIVRPLSRALPETGGLTLPARVSDLESAALDTTRPEALEGGAQGISSDSGRDDTVRMLRSWLREG